jgi:subtilisin family serine protease
VIGIIDTGLRLTGNDFFEERLLAANQSEKDRFAKREQDDDGNGHVDDIWGSNFTDKNGEIEAFGGDSSQHGTRMTAIALGGVNFVRSLSPTETPLVTARIVNFSATVHAGLVSPVFFPEAVHYLVRGLESQAHILNVSLSSQSDIRPIRNAIHSHPEVLFVVAAGNNLAGGEDLSRVAEYPARLSGNHDFASNLVTVASHAPTGRHAQHSNWGVNVDLHAPGCAVETVHIDGSVVTETGTSVATAIVSFTAGLVRALGGSRMPPEKIRQRLIASSDMNSALEELNWTTGRLNVAKAISLTHDVVETAGASTYVFGHLQDRNKLRTFCSEEHLRVGLDRIVKVRPNLKGVGNRLTIEYWVESPPRVAKVRCTQQHDDDSIGVLITESGSKDGPPLSDVVDIVPASLQIPPS